MQRIEVRYNENRAQTVHIKWGFESRPLWETIETLPIDVAIKWVDRFSPLEAIASEWALAAAVERAMGLDVPDRAEHLRAIYLEIQRVLWSLDYFAKLFKVVGEDIRREEALRLREMIFEIQETLTGNRVLPQILRVGGIDRDLSLGESKKLRSMIQGMGTVFDSFFLDASTDPLLVRRFQGVLLIPERKALEIHLQGPLGQASGVPHDLRFSQPYGLYRKYGINKFEGPFTCDVLARFRSVHFQILQSIKLLGLFLSAIPAGDIVVKDIPAKIPDGKWAAAVEGGAGPLEAKLDNGKIRLSSHSARMKPVVEQLLVGIPADDIELAVMSLGIDFAQADIC